MIYLYMLVSVFLAFVCAYLGYLHFASQRKYAKLDVEANRLLQQIAQLKSRYDKLAQEVSAATGSAATSNEQLKLARVEAASLMLEVTELRGRVAQLRLMNESLSKYEVIIDAEAASTELVERARAEASSLMTAAIELRTQTEVELTKMRTDAVQEIKALRDSSNAKLAAMLESSQRQLASAQYRAEEIISSAEIEAKKIGGEAYEALTNLKENRKTLAAIQNLIDGYGDKYLVPPRSILDDLASDFSHTDAGAALAVARNETRRLVESGMAAACDYVEKNRASQAIQFVIDAFNGKVDSILSRVKSDNVGQLQQEIKDAFSIVNHGGEAFRNARITPRYLDSRLQELKWASAAQLLKLEAQEEQRRIRDQMREEARVRREIERTLKETAKEEETIKKAIAKAEQAMAQASEEQRLKYEEQLALLSSRLTEAELKNQRAISMAQQTKRGHVYIISNVGSFGENVYKIGLTRRLEPMDRIYELGDASVPFDFDVHAMILSEDAPALENKLHKQFLLNQVNKINHRKEFFKTNLGSLRTEIEAMGLNAHWTMEATAQQYRETMAIEKRISEDESAKAAWIAGQLEMDPLDYLEKDEEEEQPKD